MNIQDIGGKIKAFLEDDKAFMAALLISVAAASFGLGRLSVAPQNGEEEAPKLALIQKPSARTSTSIEASASVGESVKEADSASAETSSSGYVASKNGTKYHLPWCSGAKRITEENKVVFETKEEAEASGYTPAANCPGI